MSSLVDSDRVLALVAGKIAREAGTLAGCRRRNVGAVLVIGGRIRGVGWNGMERGRDVPNCLDGACPRGLRSVEEVPHGRGPYDDCVYRHAEMNTLGNFRFNQHIHETEFWAYGMQVVISEEPCAGCIAYAAWAGAVLIWYSGDDFKVWEAA